jgi:hypothetical protein
MRGLCSHTSVDDEDDVADLKVDGDLGATTPVSHEWHLHVLARMAIMMTPKIPDRTKIAEVDGVGQGSENSTA